MDKPDWNELVGKVARELGPGAQQETGRTYLLWSQEYQREGQSGEWMRRWLAALGHGLLDEATYQRVVLDRLEAEDSTGSWLSSEDEIEGLIADDLAELERERGHPDGRRE